MIRHQLSIFDKRKIMAKTRAQKKLNNLVHLWCIYDILFLLLLLETFLHIFRIPYATPNNGKRHKTEQIFILLSIKSTIRCALRVSDDMLTMMPWNIENWWWILMYIWKKSLLNFCKVVWQFLFVQKILFNVFNKP